MFRRRGDAYRSRMTNVDVVVPFPPSVQETSAQAAQSEGDPSWIGEIFAGLSALDLATRVALIAAICFLAWVFRKRIAALIPGTQARREKLNTRRIDR